MRKIAILILSFLLLWSMGITAFADDITVTATVPDSHTITVVSDGAEVFLGGEPGTQFTVERLSQPTMLIRPADGKEITQVLLNNEDITHQVKGGYYTPEPIYEDKTLTVLTQDAAPAQGRTYTVRATIQRGGEPVGGVTVELRGGLKTGVTGSDGEITFTDVAGGKHSLTVVENGRIAGYVEFVLTQGDGTSLSLSEGIYAVTVNRDDAGIHLMLNLTENGVPDIESVSGIPSEPDVPQTGDNRLMWPWVLLMVIAFAGLWTTLGYHRKKS